MSAYLHLLPSDLSSPGRTRVGSSDYILFRAGDRQVASDKLQCSDSGLRQGLLNSTDRMTVRLRRLAVGGSNELAPIDISAIINGGLTNKQITAR